jgi:hypothetical protein
MRAASRAPVLSRDSLAVLAMATGASSWLLFVRAVSFA